MASVSRLTVWLHKGLSVTPFFFICDWLVMGRDSWFFTSWVPGLTITLYSKSTDFIFQTWNLIAGHVFCTLNCSSRVSPSLMFCARASCSQTGCSEFKVVLFSNVMTLEIRKSLYCSFYIYLFIYLLQINK